MPINFEEIRALGYEKAKEFYDNYKYNLDYKKVRPKFEELLKELKEIAYPEIKKAHYYPVLNEIDFLDEKQIKIFDETLYKYNKRWTISRHNWTLFGEFTYNQELVDKIIEFMLEKDMLDIRYVVSCPCGEERDVITKEQYENMKKYFDIESRFGSNSVTTEEYEWYDNFDCYRDGYMEIPCECEGLEITKMSDIDNNLSYEYKLKIEANLELAMK